MEVIIVENSEQGSQLAAQRLSALVKQKPQAVLGLATGNTPLGVYKILAEQQKAGAADFSACTCFNLDEYVGLSKENVGSYFYYMNENFYQPLRIDSQKQFIPNGMSEDIPKECCEYEGLIQTQGPIDLQLLGIGRDGHIGFNEPGSSLGSRTRLKTLTETTRQDNAHLFENSDQVPLHCITMGIQTILEAREILLLAFGEAKAKAVAAMVEGPVTAFVPGSALQFHSKVKVVVDEAAATGLKNRDYYKEVFAKKPAWQNAEFS